MAWLRYGRSSTAQPREWPQESERAHHSAICQFVGNHYAGGTHFVSSLFNPLKKDVFANKIFTPDTAVAI